MPRKTPKKPQKSNVGELISSASSKGVRVPGYRLHRASGQAIVSLGGRDFYLGPHGSAESRARYQEVVGRWLAEGRRLPAEVAKEQRSVSEILLPFVDDCEARFAGRRGERRMLQRIKAAVRGVRELYGSTPADDFGPRALLAVRQAWVEHGYCRTTVNNLVVVAKAAFKYAARHELVSASVWHGLLTVDALRRGESTAREPRKVRPVPEAFIDAALPYMSVQVAAMHRA